MKKKQRERPIASFQIHKAGEMTKEQRKEIATWMKEQAKKLLKDGYDYATRFRASFFWK